MAKNSLDQLIITKKMMDEDPNFASFSDVTNDAESDNTNSYMRPVVTLESSSRASSLAKQMDNTNTTKLCREDFDYVFDKLISRTHNFKADIQAAVESDPLMTMQDIYLKMALKANQKWDREAEVEARRDSDKSLALYLSAPLIKNKLERVKKDTKLFGYWHRHVQDMPKQN